MSLITLRSKQQSNGATLGESASLISNYFKEGIELLPGSSLELVSMSITKLEKFEIVAGQNDVFLWRIGSGPGTVGGVGNFSQHKVTIPAGNYNGADLAQTIQDATNATTLLGNYHGTWLCVFTPAKNSVPGGASGTNAKFKLTYSQNATPASNGQEITYELVETGNNASLTPGGTSVGATWSAPLDIDGSYKKLNNGFYGDRSLYPDGGELEVHIRPVKDLTDIDIVGDNWITNLRANYPHAVPVVVTQPGGLDNDWQYEMVVSDGANDAISTHGLPGDNGAISTSTIASAGTLYVTGETGALTGGSGSGATFEINTVDTGGEILTYTVTDGGHGYAVGDTLIITSTGTGTGGTLSVSTITADDGTTYTVGDTGNLVGGNGTGATYEVVSIGTGGSVTDVDVTDTGTGYVVGDLLTLDGSGASDAVLNVLSVGPGNTLRYGVLISDGVFGMATTDNEDALDESNWDYGRLRYNTTTNYLVGTDGLNGSNPTICVLSKGITGGTAYTKTLADTVYPEIRIGRSREKLISGLVNYPGNALASFGPFPGEMDASILLSNNATKDDINIQCNGFIKGAGFSYPLPYWRTEVDFTGTKSSASWNTLKQTPANWANFTYASDIIRVRVVMYGILNTRFYISHDVGGDFNWEEEVLLLQTGDANTGQQKFTSIVREVLYPYCPTLYASRGTRFDTAHYTFGGIFDTKRLANTPGLIGSTNASGIPHEQEEEEVVRLDEGHLLIPGDPGALTLSAIFKVGSIDGADIYNGPTSGAGKNQMSKNDVNPNDGNINFSLGYETAYTIQQGSITNNIITDDTRVPETSLLEPSLHVELPDFNIKSYSGESGDTGRAVAVIPKEQWTTDSQTGTLQYVAPYPIPINLRIPHPMVINELTARLRQPSGELANDLINPTEICLRLTESYETQQQRIMNNALERLNGIRSNNQDNKISNFNNDMPKI